jgi:hypothetical protein
MSESRSRLSTVQEHCPTHVCAQSILDALCVDLSAEEEAAAGRSSGDDDGDMSANDSPRSRQSVADLLASFPEARVIVDGASKRRAVSL